MHGWDTRFFDDFDDNSIGIQTDLGNGTITEPVGTELVLSYAAGVHCEWSANSPIAYEEIAPFEIGQASIMRFETRVSGFTKTGYEVLSGLILFDDRANAYITGWYDSNNDVYLQRQYDGSFGTRWQGGDYGNPNTTAHIYRIYLNRLGRPVHLTDTHRWLDPGLLAFTFSTNNGSSWVWGYSEVPPFQPSRFGVYSRNWSTYYRGTDSSFDYLKFEEAVDPQEIIGDRESERNLQVGVNIEIDADVQDMGGDSLSGLGTGYGHLAPNAAIEIDVDTHEIDPDLHAGLGFGRRIEGVDSQIEITQISRVVDADYLVEKDDSDGTELLTEGSVKSLLRVKTDTTPWSTTPAGFYGTGRDGKNYYDGEECTPTGPLLTSFGTVAGGPNRRCWSLWHQSAPLDYSTSTVPVTVSIPSDGVVRFVGTALDSEGGGIYPLWCLTGDFDIHVQWLNWSESGGTDGGAVFMAWVDPSNAFYARRRTTAGVAENGRFDRDVRINGSWSNYNFANAGGATSGWFRLVRSGTFISSYYGSPGSWTQIGTPIDMGRADPMYVGPDMWGAGSLNCSMDWSTFTINSGTVSNRVSWSSEAKGDHRGNADVFPANLGIIGTDGSMTLMDLDNDLVWMRFTEGSGKPINSDWAGTDQWVHDAAFDDGVLLVAYHGALVRIDFNLNDIRIGRLITDTNRGAVRKDTHGNGWAGYRGAASPTNAHIVTRNQNLGFNTPSFDSWAVPSRDVNSVDLWHDGGYEYRIIGTAAGLRVQKWRRWYHQGSSNENLATPDWAEWDTANLVYWSKMNKVTGDLYWMDGTNMYSRDKTGAGQGWEDWMTGGSWAAQYTKALPGTRSFVTQRKAAKSDALIYLPANEGIYRVSWPSGSWELYYGKSGSGATHEILPDYDMVMAIDIGPDDGATNLLVASLSLGQRGQAVAIKLVDNSIYGRAKKVDLDVPTLVAV